MADRYTIEEELGRGGFGTVYGASAGGGERVAVKVFSRREGLAPRADREARTARKLDHPNIHTVLGVEGDDEHVYLVSKLVEGERLDRSGLEDEQAVRAIAAVCDALAHAHARGIVHRDVKPANILVARDGDGHAHRLRHRERRGRRRPDGRRARPRHALLHVARAGRGHAARPAPPTCGRPG